MKRVSIFTAVLAFVAGLAVSCEQVGVPPVVQPEPPLAPTGLTVGVLTTNTAELSWNAADDAEKYNVVVGESDAVEVDGTSYYVTGLNADTSYSWKVQAVKGELVSEWRPGATFTTVEDTIGPPPTQPTPPPTEVKAVDVTDKTATLTWQHADADFHDVIVNGAAPVRIEEVTYRMVGLIPLTKYKCSVRSSKNGVWSGWVATEFTTLEDSGIIRFLGAASLVYYDTAYGADSQNFQFIFIDWDPGAPPQSRFELVLDFCFSRADLDVDSGRATLDIPNKTYPVITSYTGPYGETMPALNTIVSYYSDVRPIEGQNRLPYISVDGGSVTIEGSLAAGYHMDFDLELSDGNKLIGTYDGPFPFNNPKRAM